MESLRFDIEPSGIRTTIVEPGVARNERATRRRPANLAAALVTISEMQDPPLRFVAIPDALAAVEQQARQLLEQIDAHGDLSTNQASAARAARTSPRHLLAPMWHYDDSLFC